MQFLGKCLPAKSLSVSPALATMDAHHHVKHSRVLRSGHGVELCLGLSALATWPRFGQVLFFVQECQPHLITF
jgi:hypothetical protein